MAGDTLILFAQSLLIGLSIAAPVGPIGLLVIQRTLQRGPAVGLATGLGAAVADAAYGAVGAYGVSSVIQWLQGLRVPLAIGGGAFMLWLAWRTWHAAPPEPAAGAESNARGLAGSFVGTLFLTLSNPATIFSFMAIFSTLGARGPVTSPALVVAGVLIGSALWWLILCTGVAALRSRFDLRWHRGVNRLSAALLAGLAFWTCSALLH